MSLEYVALGSIGWAPLEPGLADFEGTNYAGSALVIKFRI